MTPGIQGQRGGVLVVSLIFLIVLGLMGLASMQTSRLELRMAGNEEVRTAAHQMAQALTDAIVATPAMTPVIGGAGFTLCTPGEPDCDLESLFMPVDGDISAEVDARALTARAVMTAPTSQPCPRGLGFSADKFGCTAFQLNSSFDRAGEGRGAADITQGILVATPLN